MPRGLKTGLAIAAIVALAAIAAWVIIPPTRAPFGTADIGGPFNLTDQHGRPFASSALHGKLALIYFGYTYCPDICPTELQTISAALDRLGKSADQVTPIFITVDPERDTPAVLASYLSDFSPRLIGLTGTPDQIAKVARAYRIYYAKAPGASGTVGDSYLMDHSNIIYLMGRDGRYLTHFSLQSTPDQIAAAIRTHL
jgi:protein SCO1/2